MAISQFPDYALADEATALPPSGWYAPYPGKSTQNKELPPFFGMAKVSENLIQQNFEMKFLQELQTPVQKREFRALVANISTDFFPGYWQWIPL